MKLIEHDDDSEWTQDQLKTLAWHLAASADWKGYNEMDTIAWPRRRWSSCNATAVRFPLITTAVESVESWSERFIFILYPWRRREGNICL